MTDQKNSSKLFFLPAILLVLLFCQFKPDPKTKKHTANRPNIIFILTDDQRFDMLGCAGNKFIVTPTIDKLAAKGVRFTHAFVTTPICAASRASLFTGLYERTHD